MGKLASVGLRLALMGALALTGGAIAAAPAQAALPHPGVVSEDAAETAQLVSTDAVRRPRVDALTRTNGAVYLGGLFESVLDDSGTYPRHNIAALDEATGQVLPFTLDVDGKVVALAASGDSLYLGGTFKTVNGVGRGYLVKVDAVTGEVDRGFRGGIRGRVNDLEISRGMLFVAGTFGQNLVALDPETGADTNFFDLDISGQVPNAAGRTAVVNFDIDPGGNRLVAIGDFTTIAGQSRYRAFMADLGPDAATVAPWYYEPLEKRCITNTRTKQAYLSDVDFSPDSSYFVLTATGYVPYRTEEIGETICDASARFETDIADPFRPSWINYTGGDSVWNVNVTGAAVYVQGHFRWLDNPQGKDFAGPGAVNRRGIGAIDPVTGSALPWNPFKGARMGGKAFLTTPTGLWVGSDSVRFGREEHRGLAYAPLP